MKLTTADCIIAITKHFFELETENYPLLRPALWKRLSKSGAGDNIRRTFQNKETGTIVTVLSNETQIYKIFEEIQITNIKSYLRTKLAQADNGFWDLPYEIVDDVVNWPQISMKDFSDDPDEEAFDEPLDTENFEWLSITDNEMKIACGGDWQEPLTLTIKLINGKLSVTHTEPGYEEGMDEETFIKNIQ